MRASGAAWWEAEEAAWRPVRHLAVFASCAAILFCTLGLCNGRWVHGTRFQVGLWDYCYYTRSSEKGLVTVCLDQKPNWQNAVIGLFLFAVAFGSLATVLSICGACSMTLPKKIYYYHSAGEIYFICALSTTAALIVYPVAIETEKKMAEHEYGVGYGLGWAASICFFAAALCLCLDDLVATIARGLVCGQPQTAPLTLE